jgi:hypothetical protein
VPGGAPFLFTTPHTTGKKKNLTTKDTKEHKGEEEKTRGLPALPHFSSSFVVF